VPIAFTTSGLKQPEAQFWSAVRLAVKRGLAPADALAAVTTAPANMLGVDDMVGTLTVGKLGHVVIATWDLFAADSTAEITDMWVDGDHFELETARKVDVRGTWTLTWTGAPTGAMLAAAWEDPWAKRSATCSAERTFVLRSDRSARST
jgi:hypothetical protein